MKKWLDAGNSSQDNPWNGNLNEGRRHYNREVGESGELADAEYGTYLGILGREYEDNLSGKPTKKKCKKAMVALGRLSHTEQDFFMHAIRADLGGGWNAWSVGIIGDPDHRDPFWPSSWGIGGEHPTNGHEPVEEDTNPAEYKARYDAARDYGAGEFKDKLPDWLSKCRCFCD